MTLMVPHTLYGIGIWWSPLPYMEQVSYGPTCTIWLLWSPHILYGIGILWSPHYLIWNRYHMAPHMYIWSAHMWSVFMSYITVMAPYLIWNRYYMVPLMYVWTPSCTIWLLWSPIPYMEQILYGPPMYVWSPHMWSVFMSYMTLMVPHTSYGIGIIWSPTFLWPPHVWYDFFRSPIPYME